MDTKPLEELKEDKHSEALDQFAEMFADLIWKQYWYEKKKEWKEKNDNYSATESTLDEGE